MFPVCPVTDELFSGCVHRSRQCSGTEVHSRCNQHFGVVSASVVYRKDQMGGFSSIAGPRGPPLRANPRVLSCPSLMLTEPRARWARTSTSDIKGPESAVPARVAIKRSVNLIVRCNEEYCNDCTRADISSAAEKGQTFYRICWIGRAFLGICILHGVRTTDVSSVIGYLAN